MAHHTTIKLTPIKWNAQVFNNYKWFQSKYNSFCPYVFFETRLMGNYNLTFPFAIFHIFNMARRYLSKKSGNLKK